MLNKSYIFFCCWELKKHVLFCLLEIKKLTFNLCHKLKYYHFLYFGPSCSAFSVPEGPWFTRRRRYLQTIGYWRRAPPTRSTSHIALHPLQLQKYLQSSRFSCNQRLPPIRTTNSAVQDDGDCSKTANKVKKGLWMLQAMSESTKNVEYVQVQCASNFRNICNRL